MISLIQKEKETRRFLQVCEKTAFGCKAASLLYSYGLDKRFACFWMDQETDVVFCMMDGVMILSGTVVREQETKEFLRAVGAQQVMCAIKNAEALHLPILQRGDVLRKKADSSLPEKHWNPSVNVREIYGLLEECEMVEEFEPFYLDLSHRLRHGTAFVVTEYRDCRLVGCAVVPVISRDSAVISAVAVSEEYRRQGIGTLLMQEAQRRLPGKTLYIFREQGKHQAFYKSLGYVKVDTWVQAAL